tara:strand:- start:7512 stop:8255 length:744 start_codon:yes stop_codon:yes gene_type:complete
MKKIFTLLLVVITATTFAQIDLAIKSVDQPTYIQDNPDGATTNFNLQFTLTNKGDALSPGDTIVYVFAIINRDANPNGFILEPFSTVLILGQALATGVDITTPVRDIQLTGIVGQTTNIDLALSAYVFNRTSSPVDADSTDNTLLESILWEKQYGASVANLTYNENIAAYPNPASDVLNVNLLFAKSKDVQVELFDISGKIATTQENTTAVSPTHHKLDVSGLEKGVYILKVTNGSEISTRKVTITH